MTRSTKIAVPVLMAATLLTGCQKAEPPLEAAQWRENDNILTARVARADEFTSHVKLTHSVGKRSAALNLYLGDNEQFVKKNARNITAFRETLRAAFPLQVDKQPINDHAVLTDEEPMIWATRAAIFGGRYVDDADKSTETVESFTACSRKCCFKNPAGNDINGGLGSKQCVTVDTDGRSDPRLWLIKREQETCFNAEQCVFRFSEN